MPPSASRAHQDADERERADQGIPSSVILVDDLIDREESDR